MSSRRLRAVLLSGFAGLLLLFTLFPVLWLVQISLKTELEKFREQAMNVE